MSRITKSDIPSQSSGAIREQDLRDEFQKVNEQVQRVIREADREVSLTDQKNSETEFVVEPVYTYEVHASN